MKPLKLCLLDCSSIQRYVFGSNKLKTNIGASQVVQKIYDDWVPETLKEVLNSKYSDNFTNWQRSPGKIELFEKNLIFETGYVGGGNALLLFQDDPQEDYAQKFVQQWSKKLLLKAPGIRPVIAIVPADLDQLQSGIELAFKVLKENKNKYLADTVIPRHGLTAECPLSGLSAEQLIRFQDKEMWVSSVASSKLNYYEEANQKLKTDFGDYLKDEQGNEFAFSNSLENLGQSQNVENHIGIVHIDGNNLGLEFKNCKSLIELRLLSKAVQEATSGAMQVTLTGLIQKIAALNQTTLNWPEDNGSVKSWLPLRPIILNGDDITFVCDSRVAFFLAETFMKAFKKRVTLKIPAGNNGVSTKDASTERHVSLSSCAGIVIIKTKYPFYRGYRLAEELCKNAKRKGRLNGTSWLDFHISYRGMSGSLGQIRKQNYELSDYSLLWRPWQVDDDTNMFAFRHLKDAVRELRFGPKDNRWPRSKLHAFAKILAQGEIKSKEFIQIMQVRDLALPKIPQTAAEKSGWQVLQNKNCTPYYDIIEVLEYLPECLLTA